MNNKLTKAQLNNKISVLMVDYHNKLFERLQSLELTKVLKRKNPYLFRAKNINTFYKEIIQPFGETAKERTEEFKKEYARVINRFSSEFMAEYCSPQGDILWNKLVEFNSGHND
ncbi:MAG: PmeII family type II restriction endonuclease [Verrucomicrobiota bacterium]